MSRGRRFMSEYRNRFTRLTKYPAHPSAVDRCESLWETRNRQQLVDRPDAPFMATWRVSVQKSAEGIVSRLLREKGPNVEMSEVLSCALIR
ncbi:MAG: hypothetical protein OHK006_20570 [Thermodesulfovibrionales bacterium]